MRPKNVYPLWLPELDQVTSLAVVHRVNRNTRRVFFKRRGKTSRAVLNTSHGGSTCQSSKFFAAREYSPATYALTKTVSPISRTRISGELRSRRTFAPSELRTNADTPPHGNPESSRTGRGVDASLARRRCRTRRWIVGRRGGQGAFNRKPTAMMPFRLNSRRSLRRLSRSRFARRRRWLNPARPNSLFVAR
uniref:Uncharacterized protein n=1 Tax=Mycena chlorophos TaxID=658473 RepID=A0ABQ0L069_MYCCL|nr:predicted protein [Mycena chlorophos]